MQGDVLFSCLGTTLKAAGSEEAHWKIDYQYQFAKSDRGNNLNSYVLVSFGFASFNSPFYYARMKGQLEGAVKALGFPKPTIINPTTLIRKNSDRTAEVTGLQTIKVLNKSGLFSSQKPLPTQILAQAMINAIK